MVKVFKCCLRNSNNFTEYLTTSREAWHVLAQTFLKNFLRMLHVGDGLATNLPDHTSLYKQSSLTEPRVFHFLLTGFLFCYILQTHLFQAVRKELSFNRSCYKGSACCRRTALVQVLKIRGTLIISVLRVIILTAYKLERVLNS